MLSSNIASMLLILSSNVLVGSCTAVPAQSSDQAVGVIPTPAVAPVAAVVPTLRIVAPKDGETITPPAPVRFVTTGFTLAKDGGHIEVFMPAVVGSPHIALQTSDEASVAILPANKLFTGRRDLTFVLANADGTLLENSEARVTIRGLTIEGGR